jgi:Spy/CpxP family protein refolding chaperone
MTLLKTLTLITVTGIMSTSTLSAQEETMMPPKNEMRKDFKHQKNDMRKIMQQLNLTSEQKATLKANREAMRETMKAKYKTRKDARNIGKFLSVEGIDREAMIAEATQRTIVNVNLRADMIDKMMSVFTAEQKSKFVELMKAKETK